MRTYLTTMIDSLRGGARRQPVAERLGQPFVSRLMTLIVAAAVLTNINTTPSKADMNLKLYAYNQMSWKEFECFNWLIHYESRWNPKARNGSHYGLGQMRSTWYRDLSPEAQIKASIKYIHHRYKDSCDALTHFERKGWH